MACGKASSVLESKKILRQLSHHSSEGGESSVQEELDLLSYVYFDELAINHTTGGTTLAFHVTPSTADDKERQFVYLDLNVTLTNGYPHLVPELHFGQSRGLSDAHLRGIREGLHHKSQEYLGSPMIYELVEYAKDCLTDNNKPCGQCAVCQFDFEETDEFTKTECYHYFHLPCLVRYVEFFRRSQQESQEDNVRMDQLLRKKPKELECPVCRETIAADATCLEAIRGISPSSHVDDTDVFQPSESLKSWQKEMVVLLRKQGEKGGTVDPKQEDNVIDETWVSTITRGKDAGTKKEEASEVLSVGNRPKIAQHSDGHEISSKMGHSQEPLRNKSRNLKATDKTKAEPRQRDLLVRPPPGFPPRPAGQISSAGDDATRSDSSRRRHHNPRRGREEGGEWRFDPYLVRGSYSKGPPRAKQHEGRGTEGDRELKKVEEPTPEQGGKSLQKPEMQTTESQQLYSRDQSSNRSHSGGKPHRRREHPRDRDYYDSRQWRHKQDYPPRHSKRPGSHQKQRKNGSDGRRSGSQEGSDSVRPQHQQTKEGKEESSDGMRPGSQLRQEGSDSRRPASQPRQKGSDSVRSEEEREGYHDHCKGGGGEKHSPILQV